MKAISLYNRCLICTGFIRNIATLALTLDDLGVIQGQGQKRKIFFV